MMVKICGITNREDALAAIDGGAAALGFNFYPASPRYIAPEEAAAIVAGLPAGVWKVGVFVDEAPERDAADRAAGWARYRAVARQRNAGAIIRGACACGKRFGCATERRPEALDWSRRRRCCWMARHPARRFDWRACAGTRQRQADPGRRTGCGQRARRRSSRRIRGAWMPVRASKARPAARIISKWPHF